MTGRASMGDRHRSLRPDYTTRLSPGAGDPLQSHARNKDPLVGDGTSILGRSINTKEVVLRFNHCARTPCPNFVVGDAV